MILLHNSFCCLVNDCTNDDRRKKTEGTGSSLIAG